MYTDFSYVSLLSCIHVQYELVWNDTRHDYQGPGRCMHKPWIFFSPCTNYTSSAQWRKVIHRNDVSGTNWKLVILHLGGHVPPTFGGFVPHVFDKLNYTVSRYGHQSWEKHMAPLSIGWGTLYQISPYTKLAQDCTTEHLPHAVKLNTRMLYTLPIRGIILKFNLN